MKCNFPGASNQAKKDSIAKTRYMDKQKLSCANEGPPRDDSQVAEGTIPQQKLSSEELKLQILQQLPEMVAH